MITDPTDAFTDRLAQVQGRRGTASRVPMLLGSVLAPLGVVLIGLGWLGAAHTPVLQEEIAYGISGGLIGLALVIVGSFLYFSHWQTQQIRETRAQTAALTRDLQHIVSTLDQLARRLTAAPEVAPLVATPTGTISHRPGCSVVQGKADLRPAPADLKPCRICQS